MSKNTPQAERLNSPQAKLEQPNQAESDAGQPKQWGTTQDNSAKAGQNALTNQDGSSMQPSDEKAKQQILNLQKLLERLDNTGVAQYVRLMENTPKVLWLNFLSGIARGLGFTVGTALVLAIAYKIISGIIKMNIPYLTDLLMELVHIIQGAPVK